MPAFDTSGPIVAAIEIGVGEIRVHASQTGSTVVDVAPSDPGRHDDVTAASSTRVDLANGRLAVKGPKPGLRSWLGSSSGGSIVVTVDLPENSDLVVTIGMGDVESTGTLGECRVKTGMGTVRIATAGTAVLKTGMGEVALEHATGAVDVTTGSGEVRLGRVDGTANVRNANGDSWIGHAGGTAQLSAANGNLTVDRAEGDVRAKSAFGAVRVGDVVRGTVELETQAGNLEVGIREGTAAWLDLRAVAGRVRNTLSAADGPDPSGERVSVRGRTSVGDVLVRRP